MGNVRLITVNQRRSFPAGSRVLDLLEYRGKSEGTKKTMKLSSLQRDILVGAILGDAFLQKTGERNARLRLEHGAKQKAYLLWKVEQLSQLFQGKPKYLKRVHPLTRRVYEYWRHQSQSMPGLGTLRKIFYPGGRKAIPRNLEVFLRSPMVLAVWYMDDGYYYPRDRVSYLYLGNVTRAEAGIASRALNAKYDLEARVLAKKKGFALYFSPDQTRKLGSSIRPYIIDQFNYKLPS